MNGKALGLIIGIGIILYMISSIGPYILIGLAIIALISIIVFLSINESAKPVRIDRNIPVKTNLAYYNSPNRESHKLFPVAKPANFDEEYKIIQSLINAHNKSDNSVDTNNWIIRMLRLVSKFYTKQAFKNRSLFSFIIGEANNAILNAKQTSGHPKLIRECEIIITEIKQLKNGVPIESIINQYTKNKIQNAQQLIQQKTCRNRTEIKNFVSGTEELMKIDVESNKIFIEQKKSTLITDAAVPLVLNRSGDNDKEYKLLLKLTNAYSESDKTLDISNLSIRLMNYIQMFYDKEAFNNKSLFEYIIEEANYTRSTLDMNLQQHDILECEIIVADIVQLRNGVSVESIIAKYSESKRQTIHQLVEQETYLDRLETIHLTGDAQECKEEIDESNISENNCLIKPIDAYRIRASKQVIEPVSHDTTIYSDILNHEPIKLDSKIEELGKVVGDLQFWNNYYVNSSIGNNTASQQEKDLYGFFKKSFQNGIYGLEGNSNYSFILLFDLINDYKIHKDLARVKGELQVLEDSYPKTKGYTIPAFEKAMAQDAGIEMISNEPLLIYEPEIFEPINQELKKIIDPVPFWTHYYVYSAFGINTATQDQKDFYTFFKHSFLNGIYLDLEGNLNYAFILLFDLINDYKIHKDLVKIKVELQVLGEKYPKTKGYTIAALDKAISQESGIALLSKDLLVLNEIETIELANKEENEKNALFQKWNRIKLARKSEIKYQLNDTEITDSIIKETNETTFTIEKKNDQKPIFTIDADKLTIFEQDTVRSNEILTPIFSSEEDTEDENSVTKINNDIYLEILALLLIKECWNRYDVERICKENNVIIGSTLKSINDYSYRILKDSVIEDEGEYIYITTEYKNQLLCQNA